MARVREENGFDWVQIPRCMPSAEDVKAREGARALIELWMLATAARKRAEAALRAHGLSFPLWWVLYVTDELIRKTSDAVSQRAIARRTKLDKATVSYLMGVLAERSLVDRGPEFGGPSYRIWLTKKGENLLAQASRSIETSASEDGKPPGSCLTQRRGP
jgi:DNA-binding MarR family transcriptional regulator